MDPRPRPDALPPGWSNIPDDIVDSAFWGELEASFGFQATTSPDRWPTIREPAPLATINRSPIADAIRDEDRPVVLLAAHCGRRPGEMREIDP